MKEKDKQLTPEIKQREETLEDDAERADDKAGDKDKVNPYKTALAKPEAMEAEGKVPGEPTTHERPAFNPVGNKPPEIDDEE